MSDQPILTLKNISKDYKQGRSVLEVLKNIDLQVSRSQTIAIVGASGSGKSTLLHIAELLDLTDSGTITIDGVSSAKISNRQ